MKTYNKQLLGKREWMQLIHPGMLRMELQVKEYNIYMRMIIYS